MGVAYMCVYVIGDRVGVKSVCLSLVTSYSMKLCKYGSEEMVQWLKAPAALPGRHI